MKNDIQPYTITKETPLLLYGYTKKARDLATVLAHQSYSVIGYIDARADEFDLDQLFPIYLPDRLPEWTQEEPVIILCLQSILTQIKVADLLLKRGLNKILFVSDTAGKTSEMASMMRKAYQRICLHEDIFKCKIPRYDQMLCKCESIRIVQKLEDHFCILCPIHLIYTGIPDSKYLWLIQDTDIYRKEVQKYEDINIILDRLYGSFFDYIMKGDCDCSEYIDIYAKMSGKEKAEYFSDRIKLFGLYEREYEANLGFFIETAALAKWNSNGYFNLEDGHHRVTYLQRKGHLWVPLVISQKDYDTYKNPEKESELRRYLLQNSICTFHNPEIENRLAGTGASDYQIKVLLAVWNFLFQKEDMTKYSYLDASHSQGFFAINMSRMHLEDTSLIVRDTKEKKLLEMILKLTYQISIEILNTEDLHLDYDIIFDGEIKNNLETKKLYKRSRKIYFFAFQKETIDIHKMAVPEKNVKYQKIINYFNGKEWMEYGAFVKDTF